MKKTSLFARLLCFLLVLSMLAAAAIGCAKDEEKKPQEQEQSTGDETANLDENGFLKDSLPENLNFGEIVRIVVSENQKDQVYSKELTENVIHNALYQRSLTVEERLGIEIEWKDMDATWNNNRDSFFQHIQSTNEAGDAYDALILYNLMPGALAAKGLLDNLGDSEYIDLTAPWWPDDFVNEIVVNGMLYSLVESSSTGTLKNLHGVFFNNQLLEDKQIERSPYDMVADNTWTFANMMALVKDTYSDLNEAEKPGKDYDDFFGIVTGTEAKIETWFYGMGNKYATKNTDGMPELLMNDTQYMIDWIDGFTDAAATKDFLLWDTSNGKDSAHGRAFFDNRAILYMSAIRLVDLGVSKNIQMDYGVVPVPKKDEAQERYITNVANTHDMWCVPKEAKNLEMSAAILECMASEAYRAVAPVYFDQCIKLRYAPDERLAEMYDLIRDSIVFDFASLYGFAFSRNPRSDLHTTVKNPEKYPWSSQWAKIGSTYEKEFVQILALYEN